MSMGFERNFILHRSGIEHKRRIKKFCHRPNILNSSKRIRTWVTLLRSQRRVLTTIRSCQDFLQHLNDDLVKSWQRSQSSPSITTQKCSKEEIDRGQRHERKNFQKVCIAGNRTGNLKTDRTASRELKPFECATDFAEDRVNNVTSATSPVSF